MSLPENGTARTRRRTVLVGVCAALLVVALLVVLLRLCSSPAEETTPAPAPATAAPSPEPPPTLTPTPTPSGFPANDGVYDTTTLPQIDVFAVIPALPVDDPAQGAFTGETAHPLAAAIPVWGDPTGEPVAALPEQYRFGGTTVPVLERQENWVRVLLTGRQSLPSSGDPGQISGWLRTQDIALSTVDARIEVSLSNLTIDIVHAGGATRVAEDFAWGASSTPTPLGRSFVMLVESVPEFGYTRGFPIVYLSVQSPTLDGFDGASAAVTAFHYHDARSGAISNGCIRVGEETITLLAELPPGTPVIITD